MRLQLIQKILGLFLLLYSLTLLPEVGISLYFDDHEFFPFAGSLLSCLALGLMLWLPVSRKKFDVRRSEGFLIVAVFWVGVSLVSALPLVLGPHLSVTDAFFEAVSAFTTTGATVMSGLDGKPPSILFYRQQLQWLGGMGVIVLAIAILPMLGIGGMQLYRAETPGPFKDEKIAPRIATCARSFWLLYIALTVACAIGYWLAGMSGFDALAHSLSTVSTGGFSTHDASMAYFHSPTIEMVCIVFMTLGGINFGVHYMALVNYRFSSYWRDVEVRSYLIFLLVTAALVSMGLGFTYHHEDALTSLRYGLFETVSVITSTGFGTENFAQWPAFLGMLLLCTSFVGGCAGSTAGGMKVIRFLVMFKQSGLGMASMIHPAQIKPLKLQGRALSPRVIEAVLGYCSLYVATFVLILLVMIADGMDQVTAFSAVATCMNNLGPGLGDVSNSFAAVSSTGKWVLAFAMILGRLEIFTVLVLFSPAFWRS
jgi:trk system potassium uptake protein TrkH